MDGDSDMDQPQQLNGQNGSNLHSRYDDEDEDDDYNRNVQQRQQTGHFGNEVVDSEDEVQPRGNGADQYQSDEEQHDNNNHNQGQQRRLLRRNDDEEDEEEEDFFGNQNQQTAQQPQYQSDGSS